ncbi:MAG: transcriptional regulator [Desulfurococcales archaeon]|nr:transcriptional regulator [Desulfurococcales archaeon]
MKRQRIKRGQAKEEPNQQFKLELPCEYAGKIVIPSIRAVIAKTLVEEYNYSRYRAAKLLGLTPAAVTYYLNGERGRKLIENISVQRDLMNIIREISEMIAKNDGINTREAYVKYRESICKICSRVNIYAQMAGCHGS